ncbi:MAG: vitamin B12-dependent ribonucleotide reductase [Candidatus Berkelbacteria bacterium]|nr:vitamin B12-dependent ribonucleotide reductase [Candidatus Berkelbacteria bacterium]
MPKVAVRVQTKTPSGKKKGGPSRNKKGLKIERFFTKLGEDPFESTQYELRSSKISNADGSVVFEMNDIEIPRNWSRLASDILISKYLRKSQVPQYDKYGKPILDKDGKPKLGAEQSVKQIIKRLAYGWRWWGEKFRYFTSRTDADRFEDELSYMLLHQYGAPNSPQWFNTGLALRYGITGPAQGHWYADPKTGKLKQSEDAYTRPQPHACFIQSIKDDLVNSGGIFDLAIKEARIFKYGSGNGTNFSSLRAEGEPLSGGGKSSGLMSWLQIFDRGAGAIKSGGTTRRASKMVIINIDHPDIEKFIGWKYKEEEKAAALIAAGYTGGIEGQAYQTVSGQNSNNSIRVTDDFMRAVEQEGEWHLRWRTNPEHISKTVKAKQLWDKIADAAWRCGDPGLQFDTNINNWHTCLSSGRINASNPCSEFMFLDDSSCNLASLNLVKFYDEKNNQFNITAFQHAVRLWTIVLEISVLMAQFPSYEIAKNSYLYRPLGLGYANLGALLMIAGKPYDSDRGRGIAAAITSLMTATAYATSAEMAKEAKPFEGYEKNKADMLRVIRNHRRAAYNAKKDEYENLTIKPFIVEEKNQPEYILKAAREAWDKALLDGGRYGFRNAQVTLLAPTGTIGLVMDCDTTGVEPDYALVKFKKLAGGGCFKIINQSVLRALKNLKYKEEQIDKIIEYIIGSGSLENAPHVNRTSLLQKGLTEADIKLIGSRLSGSFDISQTFNSPDIVTKDNLAKWGISQTKASSADFNLLSELGFSKEQISEANRAICGSMSAEGAPYLKEEHLSIFDCANKCGEIGKRFILADGHIKMMATAQPFLSGAISKTVNLPNEATKEEIEKVYMESWRLGLKAIAIYRDGSKVSQPLTSKEIKTKEETSETVVEYKPVRQRMPKERMSITRKVSIGGHKMYFTVGLYNDGRAGELFIVMNQQGSFAAGMADSFAKMVSIGLQYGVPLETIISQLKHMRFQPMGYTGDPDVQSASSISDYIAQWFQKKFLEGKTKAVELPFEKEKEADENGHEAGRLFFKQAQSDPARNLENLSSKLGFSGEMCLECGSATMVLNGKCYKCLNCGATTGCS